MNNAINNLQSLSWLVVLLVPHAIASPVLVEAHGPLPGRLARVGWGNPPRPCWWPHQTCHRGGHGEEMLVTSYPRDRLCIHRDCRPWQLMRLATPWTSFPSRTVSHNVPMLRSNGDALVMWSLSRSRMSIQGIQSFSKSGAYCSLQLICACMYVQ